MNHSLHQLLSALRDGLKSLYGQRLQGVYLYGSYARNEATSESDVDVLIVLDTIRSYGEEVQHTSHLIASLSLEHGVSISRVFVSHDAWATHTSPFLANVQEEAVPV
jgi:type I restriction enzyme S subunit